MKKAVFFLLTSCLTLAFSASGQFPAKPVRLVVPSSPGGGIDSTARAFAAKLQEYWRQGAVVENRPGALMIIGTDAVAKSAADGYTLLIAHDGAMAMNPVVVPNLSYDVQRDFAPISLLTTAPLILMVHPAAGFKSVQDLVVFARANPGRLNHATGGPATLLALELFNALAGVQITSVPYKGAAPAFASLMAGETQLAFGDVGSAAATLKSGQVRVLGIATLQRSNVYADWKTIDEQGVKGYETRTWIGAFAPAGTPADVVAKLAGDMHRAASDQGLRERLQAINFEVIGSNPEELARAVRADTEKWGRLVRERNIKIGQ